MEILLTSQPTIEQPIEAINPVDSVLPFIASAVEEWKAAHTEESIKHTVTNLLEKNKEQMVLKLLGFNESWGKWELDHCNGRAGNSAAGEFLRAVQQTAIEDWMAKLILPTVSKTATAEIQKSANQSYRYELEKRVREMAVAQANKDAQAIIQSIVQSNQIEARLKVMQLIDKPTNPT